MDYVDIVRSATIMLGDDEYNIISYTAGSAKSVDVIDVTCIGDARRKKVGGRIVRHEDMEFEIIGAADPSALVGNGNIGTVLTVNDEPTSFNAIVKSCTPHEIEVEGNRIKAWDIVLTRAVSGVLSEV